jgi:hypothetical protein
MKNMDFRSEPTYYYDPTELDKGQLVIPVDLDMQREVHWVHGKQTKKWGLLGRRIVTNLVMQDHTYMPKVTYINASAIAELVDPDLRYSLRFADAASAVGWTEDSPGSSSAHDVWVTATDEGVESKFISASYTGIGKNANDTFMQNLHSAAPEQI